jgi:hypothetical protein
MKKARFLEGAGHDVPNEGVQCGTLLLPGPSDGTVAVSAADALRYAERASGRIRTSTECWDGAEWQQGVIKPKNLQGTTFVGMPAGWLERVTLQPMVLRSSCQAKRAECAPFYQQGCK